jgi:beta-lactamase regulating signal transducer with metallopeptidase domain
MIPFLNETGRLAFPVASSMLWQTAVLVMGLLLVEVLAGRRLRATLRCGLWLLVIVKLLLPPSLKSPLSPGYWIGRWITPPLALPVAPTATTIPQVNPVVSASIPFPRVEASEASEMPAVDRTVSGFPRLNAAGALMGLWILGSVALAFGVLRRNQQVRRLTGTARPASADLLEALRSAASELGLRRLPELRLTQADHSPAVSGFLHPVIVLPAELATHLTPSALRDVLLHELIHVRRRDLWLNLPQALVQIIWWWNPFVWLANARIRLLREQAVDEQVMLLTHGEEESTYPATLVAVARYCADRPVLTLSFVGILESRHHLRSRVERLLNGPLPPRAGLGRLGWLTLVLTACLALPMAFARRVDPSSEGAELSARVYRFDPERLMAALEERVSYTVDDFSVDDLPSNHGGDFSDAPGGFILGVAKKQEMMSARIHGLLGKYFGAEGVTFATPIPGNLSLHQKSFSFNASTGTLIVAASDAELAAVDKALQNLSVPQAIIRPIASSPPLTSTLTVPTSEAEGASNLPEGTQIQTNGVHYVSRPAENKESTPKFYAMDPILARRYGLIPPANTPTNSPPPAASSQPEAGRSVYAMDPILARRYGLIPSNSTPTNSPPATSTKPGAGPSVYAIDPVLARRYGLVPLTRGVSNTVASLNAPSSSSGVVHGSPDELLTRTFPLTITFPKPQTERAADPKEVHRNAERIQRFAAGLMVAAGVTIPAFDPSAGADTPVTPKWFIYDEVKGLLTVRATEEELSAVQQMVRALSAGAADIRIGVEIRVFEVANSAEFSLSTGSSRIDEDPRSNGLAISELGSFQILSGLEMERLMQSANDLKSSRSLVFGSASGPARRRVGLGFDGEVSIGLTEVQESGPDSSNPFRVVVIPSTQPGITGIDLDVLVRRTPDDSSPTRQRAHVMSGESLVLARTPLPANTEGWTQYVIVTPNLVDPAAATDGK